MRAAKGQINAKREKNKKTKTDVLAGAVMGELVNPHVDQGWLIAGMCARNSSIIRHSNLIRSWGWRALYVLFCLCTQRASWRMLFTCVPVLVFVVDWQRT